MNNDMQLSIMEGILEIQFAEKYQPLLVLALLSMPLTLMKALYIHDNANASTYTHQVMLQNFL